MSALLQTAMANASLQSGHPVSPAKSGRRLPSDKGRVRSSASASSKELTDEDDFEDQAGYSDDDSDDDEMVALATRPSTPVSSHSRERETPDSAEKAGRFIATRDPVSISTGHDRERIVLSRPGSYRSECCLRASCFGCFSSSTSNPWLGVTEYANGGENPRP